TWSPVIDCDGSAAALRFGTSRHPKRRSESTTATITLTTWQESATRSPRAVLAALASEGRRGNATAPP
ncbi:hypothetical protein, partial [Mesorhizobium sp. M5C.F.Ca.IN.020.29.1.1]|uniref:hypothetical protein n=1 Tax=Mesorhizobium sp. M5C.F.Ca.IN.020.29.1.1 TaxID=2496770 RepID=UPI0019D310CF